MVACQQMIETNHALIKYGKLDGSQSAAAVEQLLAARSEQPGPGGRYPLFFVPPAGERLKTVMAQTPKTKIFAGNMYELEVLRLLWVLAPENQEVRQMTTATLDRLKDTCFGSGDDGLGECFDASLVVLRFLAAAAPQDTQWIQSRIDNFNRHRDEKKRPWFSLWYYWLCLSELPFALARPEVDKYKDAMLNWLANKSFVMHSGTDRSIHPMLACMLRNNLARYPEYGYIAGRQPYISEKNGRLYFDMKR